MHHSDPFDLIACDALTADSTGPGVSVYLPTHQATNHVADYQIHKYPRTEAFKGMLAEIVRRPDAEELPEPVDGRLKNDGTYLSDGLTILSSPSFHATYRRPMRFEPTSWVSHRFIVKPLLPLLADDGKFRHD